VLDRVVTGGVMQTLVDSTEFATSIARSVGESVDAAVAILDSEVRIKDGNSPFYRMLGTSPEKAQGEALEAVLPRHWDISELRQLLRHALRDGRSFQDVEIEQKFPVLGHRLFLVSGRQLGDLQLIALVINDITDRVERDLRLAAIVESAEDAILSKTLDGTIVSWNSGAERMYGYAAHEVIGKPITILCPPGLANETVSIVERIRRGERVSHFETKRQRKDGKTIDVSVTVSPIRGHHGVVTGASVVARDITELKRSQEAALIRQKLETVGQMASSLGHDFNNLLGGVLMNVELAQMQLASGLSADEELQRIGTLAVHGSEIVRQLMTYAAQDDDTLDMVDISRTVSEMLDLVKASISKHPSLEVELATDLPLVRSNSAQIRQIVMNLIMNAAEAIGEAQGVIRVVVSHLDLRRRPAIVGSDKVPPGDYVHLEVCDTGCGMPVEVQQRVFEPFFTTKAARRGLGLAVARQMVQSWSGTILFQSEPGEGTTFHILLPCAEQPASEAEGRAGLPESEEPWTGTVLVVEDEDLLRIALTKMLRSLGFSVIAAREGWGAVELIESHKDDLGVILLDVTLPGMSSEEVLAKVLQTTPDAKVIVTSAYSREMLKMAFPGLPLAHFIRKPYSIANLTRELRGVRSQ
jgi:PAS domain S-box-containing protein